MRTFRNIVESNKEPDTNSIWLKEDKLHVYTKGEWQPITGDVKKKEEDS